ncbi:hypothetical protein OAR16_00325 [bacterium]|nr:hypothetical protein [bacterium]
MNNIQFEKIQFDSEARNNYDLVLVALGYETRSIAIPLKLFKRNKNLIAIGFDYNKRIAYLSNCAWYKSENIECIENISDANYSFIIEDSIKKLLLNQSPESPPLRISCDISCLNRFRIASILDITLPLIQQKKLTLDIWYTLGKYQPPETGFLQNEVAGPVHSRFAGWFKDPGRATALVAGLGYEQGKVMGTTEYIQASKIVVFIPRSPIKQYEPALQTANSGLLYELPDSNKIEYAVEDPLRTLALLDSAIRGLEEEHNVVILPLGPKIFSALALLIQTFHANSSVWRVSSGRLGEPRDVTSSGHIYGLRVR